MLYIATACCTLQDCHKQADALSQIPEGLTFLYVNIFYCEASMSCKEQQAAQRLMHLSSCAGPTARLDRAWQSHSGHIPRPPSFGKLVVSQERQKSCNCNAVQEQQAVQQLMHLKQELATLQERIKHASGLVKTPQGLTDYGQDFFGKPTFLTVSGQLNAEIYATAMSDVYTFGRAPLSSATLDVLCSHLHVLKYGFDLLSYLKELGMSQCSLKNLSHLATLVVMVVLQLMLLAYWKTPLYEV